MHITNLCHLKISHLNKLKEGKRICMDARCVCSLTLYILKDLCSWCEQRQVTVSTTVVCSLSIYPVVICVSVEVLYRMLHPLHNYSLPILMLVGSGRFGYSSPLWMLNGFCVGRLPNWLE